MAEKACHGFGSTTQVGLTQVLGRLERSMRIKQIGYLAIFACVVACSDGRPELAATPEPQGPTPTVVAPLQAENDRICMKAYGVVCHAIPHLPGPVNAEAFGEDRACVREGVAKLVDGEWEQDNKYLNRETGERYGDICIAVSL